jgi:predicted nucleic acid-binding protein
MIFLDAGAFIARHRPSDDYHKAALRGWRELEKQKRPCCTTSLVIAEAAQFVGRAAGGMAAASRLRLWLSSDWLRVVRSDREIELEAAALLERYADQHIGFTDCVSFAVMRRQRIDTVFGFDRHFRVAGFKLWPAGK